MKEEVAEILMLYVWDVLSPDLVEEIAAVIAQHYEKNTDK